MCKALGVLSVLVAIELSTLASNAHAHSGEEEQAPTPAEKVALGPVVEPTPPVAEHAVTVRGPRVGVKPASTTVVTAREIKAVPKRSAEDVLRLVPGLTLVQHGSEGKGYQFFLRGFDAIHGSDFEVTLDGIPLNEWSNIHGQGYLDLGFVVPEAIQSVDVTKGPFTLSQGAFATAGSADYHLGLAEEALGTRLSYTASTTNRHRAAFIHSPHGGDGKQLLAAEALRDDGFGQNRALMKGSVLGQTPLAHSADFGTLSVLGALYFADFELPGSMREDDVSTGRKGFYDSYDHAGHGRSGKALLALVHTVHAQTGHLRTTLYAGRRRLALLENYTGFLYDAVEGDRRQQLQETWSIGANATYLAHLTSNLNLNAGLGERSDHLAQTQTHVGRQQRPLSVDRSLEGWQHLVHGFAGLEYRPLDDFRVAAGGRVDLAYVDAHDRVADTRRSAGALWAISPRITAEWALIESTRVFAAYGRGFRPPEARAFTSYDPASLGFSEQVLVSDEPSMTLVDAAELGVRSQINRYLGGSLVAFGAHVARESVFDHVSGLNLELNSTRRLGGELQLYSNPVDWLLLMADLTGVDARFVRSGAPIPLAPWMTYGARAIVTHPGGLRAGLRCFGLAPRHLPHGARGSTLGFVDLSVGYEFDNLEFALELENLFDARLREGEYHYASNWRTGESSQLPVVHYVPGPPFNARASVAARW